MNEERIQPNINEWSYQRYAAFYNSIQNKDEDFKKKITEIVRLILDDHETSLKAIADMTGCTYEEVILKICYLKNKRVIGDYYVDSAAGIISNASPEDVELIKRYSIFIYGIHADLEDIALRTNQTKEKVWEDLKYLDNKKLINGVILNEVDNKIVYYHVEKHKKERDFVTVSCPNCGGLLDIKRGSKGRCNYCDTIIEDNIMEKVLELLKEKEIKMSKRGE